MKKVPIPKFPKHDGKKYYAGLYINRRVIVSKVHFDSEFFEIKVLDKITIQDAYDGNQQESFGNVCSAFTGKDDILYEFNTVDEMLRWLIDNKGKNDK